MLNPTGSFDFSKLTYSFALTSPASKCEIPFCSGNPCLATFSLWKLKNTNLPRKSERPVLRLMTSEGFSSALTTRLFPRFLEAVIGRQKVAEVVVRESVGLLSGLSPWMVGAENRAEAIAGCVRCCVIKVRLEMDLGDKWSALRFIVKIRNNGIAKANGVDFVRRGV